MKIRIDVFLAFATAIDQFVIAFVTAIDRFVALPLLLIWSVVCPCLLPCFLSGLASKANGDATA